MCGGEHTVDSRLLVDQRLLVYQGGGTQRWQDHRFVWQQHPGGSPGNGGHRRARCHHCSRLVLVGAIHDHHVVCSIGQIFHKTFLL